MEQDQVSARDEVNDDGEEAGSEWTQLKEKKERKKYKENKWQDILLEEIVKPFLILLLAHWH